MKRRSGLLKLGVAAIALAVVVGSCKDDDDELPPIDGYNSSDEVASSNLVAHWTFDDDQRKESISGTAPSNTYGTVAQTNGQIGGALQLNKGALVYPAIEKINSANALGNFTVSLWVNVANVKGQPGAGNGFMSLFSLIPTAATDIWGDIVAGVEAGHHMPASDTIVFKNLLVTHLATGANFQDNLGRKNGDVGDDFLGAKKWSHYVLSWNATTHQFKIYANGKSIGAYDDRGTTPELVMAVPVQPVFGSLAAQDIGFADAPVRSADFQMAQASIDDVRVFNNVLSDAEITALFNLGTAGR